MKFKKLLLIVPVLFLANTVCGQQTIQQKFKQLEWLEGKWVHTNSKKGQSGYETWKKVSDTKITGKGVTSKGNKTIFVEDLEFVAKGTDLFYAVKLTGEKEIVYFKLTELNDNGFICENPKNPFPTKITYKKTDKGMDAIISDSKTQVFYHFVPDRKIHKDFVKSFQERTLSMPCMTRSSQKNIRHTL